jgi:hypothetical protein
MAAAKARPRARKAARARSKSAKRRAWKKVKVILGMITVVLGLGTAILDALPMSPSPTVVVVIYPPSQQGSGTRETHPNRTSGPGGHQADDRNRACAGKSSPWPRPRQRAAGEAAG